MNATEAGLLEAILASPADDTPRLIYADWLDENGQPERAEFIRVQIELSRLDGVWNSDSGRYHLRNQESDLRRRERELWTGCDVPLDGIPDDWIPTLGCDRVTDAPILHDGCFVIFRRGFVADIKCQLADWLTHGPAIVRAQPVERVLTEKRPRLFHQASNEHITDSYWIWTIAVNPHFEYSCSLPGEILEMMPMHAFDTAAAAQQALSDALLAWAKEPGSEPPTRR